MTEDIKVIQRTDRTLWVGEHFVGYSEYPIGKREIKMIVEMELACREAEKMRSQNGKC